MSIAQIPDVMKFCGAQDSEKDTVELIQNSVEEWIQSIYCRRNFELQSYKEVHNGGVGMLQLKNYPITAITRLATGVNVALYVSNTETSTNATVAVTSTAVVLTKDGTATLVAFETYTTIQSVVDYINTLSDSGWAAKVVSAYASFLSTELVIRFGSYCLNDKQVGLHIPGSGETEYNVYPKQGQIKRSGCDTFQEFQHYQQEGFNKFPSGLNNIFVDYVAGYSAADMPSQLKLAVEILVKYIYQRKSEESFGLKNYSVSGIKAIFQENIPNDAARILDGFVKILV